MLAHAGGADEFGSTIMVAGALVIGWVGLSRLRGRAFPRVPRWSAWGLTVLAPGVLVASFVVPERLWPTTTFTGPRPASTATIAFAEPSPGQVVGDDTMDILLTLDGATIVEGSSSNVTPDTGHIHIYLDGEIVSMTYGEDQAIATGDLEPGTHRLLAEFVAADHAPFAPRVTATVTFVKEET